MEITASGDRGTVIGCLVIGIMNNGMNLMGIDSSWQYVVKGVVVLLAVFIDYVKKENKMSGLKIKVSRRSARKGKE